MKKEKFKIGQIVKCPKGVYNISYFIELVTFQGQPFKVIKDYFEKGFQIMIKGVGLYNEDELEVIEEKQEITIADIISKLEGLTNYELQVDQFGSIEYTAAEQDYSTVVFGSDILELIKEINHERNSKINTNTRTFNISM